VAISGAMSVGFLLVGILVFRRNERAVLKGI
jgi:hypothetical protein